MLKIPVVDMRRGDFADNLLAASREFGFVSISGHGVDPSLFAEMRDMLKKLFEADDEAKQAGAITRDNYRGFIPMGFFTPNRAEHNGREGDTYEGYKLHWECPDDHQVLSESKLYGTNLWAAHVPQMAQVVSRYWHACDTLAARLLDVFAEALDIDTAVFRSWHEAPLTNMTLLHYPPQEVAAESAGMHPHKDTNVLTLLHPGPVGGLLIRTGDGQWIDANPPPEAMLVNIGEMLELWSGGDFRATPHQVVNQSGRERYSFPYFIVPNHSVVVEPVVECQPGFDASLRMPVGSLSAEVWRTNWPDEQPSASGFDLGTLDRTAT